ncbi:hypothetical protein Tsubulata_025423 [Turnera subulata]|uniref:Biogenesis of lysosome-related organelles complex 1 subunit 1 n=1 Tax=Turnera subulata TaxID=218843 RepID=A0A9Q0G826_9ROSI|nr:hypothetical protein Tsubulata_025423 [Turnera subulata]
MQRKNAVRVSGSMVDAVNAATRSRLSTEGRALAATIARVMKQTDQCLTASHAIKEIGDIENWMKKTMEFDCKSITASIKNIHQD